MHKRWIKVRNWLLVKLAGDSQVMINCTVMAPLMGPAKGQSSGFCLHNLVIGEGVNRQRIPEIAESFFVFKGSGVDWLQAHPEFAESGQDVDPFKWPWPEDDRGLYN